MQLLEFEFKLVHSNLKRKYSINPDISISEFINIIRLNCREYFNLNHDETIEIIEAGLPNGEYQDSIKKSNLKFLKKYYNKIDCLAFYVRKIAKIDPSDIISIFSKKLDNQNIRNIYNFIDN
jgi:hypothetical protein